MDSLAFFIFSCSLMALSETLQGHRWYLLAEEAGGAEKRFLENFGNVIRWNGPFGVFCVFY